MDISLMADFDVQELMRRVHSFIYSLPEEPDGSLNRFLRQTQLYHKFYLLQEQPIYPIYLPQKIGNYFRIFQCS